MVDILTCDASRVCSLQRRGGISCGLEGCEYCSIDQGEFIQVDVFTDSVAAQGIIGRRGLGKVRHMEVGYFWLQDSVADKKIKIDRVRGTENPADMGTKNLSAEGFNKCLALLSCCDEHGRSQAVPSIAK